MLLLFWIAFVVTLLLLGGALWTGWSRRRRLHLVVAPLGLVALGVAILLAEQLGRTREFPPTVLAIHLFFAKTGALLALPVVATGVLLLRNPRWRRLHRIAVLLFAAGALTATATGIWMFSLSTPK